MGKILTREEAADLLNMPATDLSNIRRELIKRGYEFNTSGRGDTYLINITKEPEINLIWFAKTFFGLNIQQRREKDFAHFLNFLFTSGEKNTAINYPTNYIETRTFYTDQTIRTYIEAIRRSRAFRNTGIPTCWGIRYQKVNLKSRAGYLVNGEDWGQYEKKKLIKSFIKQHKDFCQQTYWNYYEYWMEENKKPGAIKQPEWQIRIDANKQKKMVAGGWWVLPHEYDVYMLEESWRPLPLLLSLLGEYKYEDIYKTEVINIKQEWEEYYGYEEIDNPELKNVRPPEDYNYEPEVFFEPDIEMIATVGDLDTYIPNNIYTIEEAMSYLHNSGEYKKFRKEDNDELQETI